MTATWIGAQRGRTDSPASPADSSRPLTSREADALWKAELLAATRAMTRTSTELAGLLRGGQLTNGILDAGTSLLDSSGVITRSWNVQAGSVAIVNHTAAALTVTNGPSSTPTGRGTFRVAAGGSAVVPVGSTDLTITGTPGGAVTFVVFTGLQPPSFSSPGSSSAAGQPTAATATLSSVPDGTTSAVLLPANTARKGAAIYNDSSATLFVAFAATASATAFTIELPAGAYYELPTTACYTGVVSGVWDADSTGSARITELS